MNFQRGIQLTWKYVLQQKEPVFYSPLTSTTILPFVTTELVLVPPKHIIIYNSNGTVPHFMSPKELQDELVLSLKARAIAASSKDLDRCPKVVTEISHNQIQKNGPVTRHKTETSPIFGQEENTVPTKTTGVQKGDITTLQNKITAPNAIKLAWKKFTRKASSSFKKSFSEKS